MSQEADVITESKAPIAWEAPSLSSCGKMAPGASSSESKSGAGLLRTAARWGRSVVALETNCMETIGANRR